MFVHNLRQIADQLRRVQPNNSIQNFLVYGIKFWCSQLYLPENITNYILKHYQQWGDIQTITDYFWHEWQPSERERKEGNIFVGQTTVKFLIQSRLNYLITKILNQINIKGENMEFLALIAFAITAIGYLTYVSNRPRQQLTHTEELKARTTDFSGTLLQKTSPQFLVLVIAADKATLIKSIREKQHISYSDGEELYEITNYLWLGSESAFAQKISSIKDYLVSPGEESEYDIYLGYLKLKQSDEGFKPSVNQLDRYDAFRQLPDLILNFEFSPRLQMEAYSNFEIYSR